MVNRVHVRKKQVFILLHSMIKLANMQPNTNLYFKVLKNMSSNSIIGHLYE